MKNILRTHWVSVIFAVCVGLVLVSPQLIFMQKGSYQGVDMIGGDAETHYLARMRELYDGNYFGNPFLAEFKNQQYSPYFTPIELVLAVPGKLFHIGVPTLNLIYKFFFPAVIFLLVYGLLWRITAERLVSISGASLIVLGYQVVTVPGLVNLLHWNQAYHQFALYARPINPEVSGILFWVFLHFLYSLLITPRRRDIIIAGVVLGSSFYVYFYLWTFLYMLCGVFFLACLWKKISLLPIIIISAVGMIIGTPVLYFSIKALHSPFYENFGRILGVANSHAIAISTLGLGVLVILCYVAYKNLKLGRKPFLWIILGGAFVSMLQNVVTGLNLQPGHYHWYFSVPIFSLIIVIAIATITNNYNWLKKIVLLAVIVISFLNTYLIQKSSYAYWLPQFTEIQQSRSVFEWLNDNTPNNSVVFSNALLSELIPVYTHNNVFWNLYSLFYLMPTDSIKSRLAYYLKLEGYTCQSKYDPKQTNAINQDIKAFGEDDIINSYQNDLCKKPSRYQNFPEPDYLLVDSRHDYWKIPVGAKIVYNKNPYIIYKIQ